MDHVVTTLACVASGFPLLCFFVLVRPVDCHLITAALYSHAWLFIPALRFRDRKTDRASSLAGKYFAVGIITDSWSRGMLGDYSVTFMARISKPRVSEIFEDCVLHQILQTNRRK
jgi:hypothetical protein